MRPGPLVAVCSGWFYLEVESITKLIIPEPINLKFFSEAARSPSSPEGYGLQIPSSAWPFALAYDGGFHRLHDPFVYPGSCRHR
jgi:hypothetical protein